MASGNIGSDLGEKGTKILNRMMAWALPDWQVFLRRPDGKGEHFTISRRGQMIVLGVCTLVLLWGAVTTGLLLRQPDDLLVKARTLDEMMAENRATQARLAAAEKMIQEVTKNVESVHQSISVLAQANQTLINDQASANRKANTPLQNTIRDDDPLLASVPEVRRVRDVVNKLEESLGNLRVAYTRAAQQTAQAAGAQIQATEKTLAKLGVELVPDTQHPTQGVGGPFVPPRTSAEESLSMGALMERMQYWTGMKAGLSRLPLAEPVRTGYSFTSNFGHRSDPFSNRTAMHEGVDFRGPVGTPIYATGEGTVVLAGNWGGYGRTIDINHGNGITTRYAHLSRIKVTVGQKVTRNTVIGLMGNSGRSTGSHLHYEVRVNGQPRDPVKFISVGRDVPKNR